jgi:hypothetical protein
VALAGAALKPATRTTAAQDPIVGKALQYLQDRGLEGRSQSAQLLTTDETPNG